MIQIEGLLRFAIAVVVTFRTMARDGLGFEHFEKLFDQALDVLTERTEMRARMFELAAVGRSQRLT
jgi:hypothetical protein